ncbi:hypothetical protein HZY88_08705 [Aerococcaceae bacterium DSM 111176]|nr:hypothetical protein [Aerococcaceae bacterium DSM 111176]
MEPKKKKTRWGCIIGVIVIVLLLPVAFIYGPWIFFGLIVSTYPDKDDVSREGRSFLTKYDNISIDNDETFLEFFIDLAPQTVEVNGFPHDIDPYIEIEDIYNLLGEPTTVYKAVFEEDSRDDYIHSYDYFPYIASFDKGNSDRAHLDYYTETYYEPEELDNLFYQAINDFRQNDQADLNILAEQVIPSKIRQTTVLKDQYRVTVYYLSSQDINSEEELSMPTNESIFNYYPEIIEIGNMNNPKFEISRTRETASAEVDPYLSHLMRNSNTKGYNLFQIGETIAEINDSIDGEPYYIQYKEGDSDLLTVYWKVYNGNEYFRLEATINVDEETNIAEESLKNFPIETLDTNYPNYLNEWQEIEYNPS